MMKTRIMTSALMACMTMLPLTAIASSTWQMWDNTNPYACNLNGGTTYSMGNSYQCSAVSNADPLMNVNAWSTTGSGYAFAEASVRRWNWTSTPDTPVTMAGQTSGFDYGVVNAKSGDSTSPDHSLDNHGYTDVLALNFTEDIALTSVSLGWVYNDADISILRYTGPEAGAPNIAGKTIAQLTTTGGWELVGHYANLQNDVTAPARTAEIKDAGASSWWLISAFNAGYGNGTTTYGGTVYSTCNSGLTCGNDYVKLLQVAGNVVPRNETPEPGSVVLLGIGLFGIMAMRRRRSV